MDRRCRYEVRVRGRLSDTTAELFAGLHSEPRTVETSLVGELRDQSELHEILRRIQDLGIELLEVRQLPDPRS